MRIISSIARPETCLFMLRSLNDFLYDLLHGPAATMSYTVFAMLALDFNWLAKVEKNQLTVILFLSLPKML